MIARGIREVLFDAKVPLGRLNRSVTERDLNLFGEPFPCAPASHTNGAMPHIELCRIDYSRLPTGCPAARWIRHSPVCGIAAKIVRSQSGEAEIGGVLFHYVPDYPFGYTVAPVLSGATDTSEHPAGRETGCRSPKIKCCLRPVRYRHGTEYAHPCRQDPRWPSVPPVAPSAGTPDRPTHADVVRIQAGRQALRGPACL